MPRTEVKITKVLTYKVVETYHETELTYKGNTYFIKRNKYNTRLFKEVYNENNKEFILKKVSLTSRKGKLIMSKVPLLCPPECEPK